MQSFIHLYSLSLYVYVYTHARVCCVNRIFAVWFAVWFLLCECGYFILFQREFVNLNYWYGSRHFWFISKGINITNLYHIKYQNFQPFQILISHWSLSNHCHRKIKLEGKSCTQAPGGWTLRTMQILCQEKQDLVKKIECTLWKV